MSDAVGRASGTAGPFHHTAWARSPITSWTLRLATAATLGINAVIHASNASAYDAVKATLTEGQLFRFESGLAIAAGLLVLISPRRSSWVGALLVGAGALAAVLLYRYVDIGTLGPLPNMFEDTWREPGKLLSAYAEGATIVFAALGLLLHAGGTGTPLQRRATRQARSSALVDSISVSRSR